MKHCITEEEARMLILTPGRVPAEMAMHVFNCSGCQELLRTAALEIAEKPSAFPEQSIWTEFKSFFESEILHARPRNNKPSSLLEGALLSTLSFLLPGAGTMSMVCGASLPGDFSGVTPSGQKEIVCKMLFKARHRKGLTRFWNAELPITNDFSDDALLTFLITDHHGSAIESGRLKIASFVLPVFMGLATISFGDFRKSMNTPEIAFIYPDGEKINGELVFFE